MAARRARWVIIPKDISARCRRCGGSIAKPRDSCCIFPAKYIGKRRPSALVFTTAGVTTTPQIAESLPGPRRCRGIRPVGGGEGLRGCSRPAEPFLSTYFSSRGLQNAVVLFKKN